MKADIAHLQPATTAPATDTGPWTAPEARP